MDKLIRRIDVNRDLIGFSFQNIFPRIHSSARAAACHKINAVERLCSKHSLDPFDSCLDIFDFLVKHDWFLLFSYEV